MYVHVDFYVKIVNIRQVKLGFQFFETQRGTCTIPSSLIMMMMSAYYSEH